MTPPLITKSEGAIAKYPETVLLPSKPISDAGVFVVGKYMYT
jgi:hypothetical protein